MKYIITIIITFITLTISAKTVVKSPATGKVLDNTMGVYSIKGNSGVIILGTEDQARHFMISAADCFINSRIGYDTNINDQKYRVAKDEVGLYIFRIGLSPMKIRSHDVMVFGAALGCKKIFKEVKEGLKYLKENGKTIWQTLHE